MAAPISVFIVDDHRQILDAVSDLVAASEGFEVAGVSLDGDDIPVVDLVLMDINLTGRSGIDLTRDLTESGVDTKVILMSTYRREDLPVAAATCGASGYLPKSQLGLGALRDAWEDANRTSS